MRSVNCGSRAPQPVIPRGARAGRAGVGKLLRPRRRDWQLPEGMRIYAIGDVHGRADLLSELFAAIDADLADRPPADTLHVFLGDYIDRGPESQRAIDLVIARCRSHETVLLKGNHETFPA